MIHFLCDMGGVFHELLHTILFQILTIFGKGNIRGLLLSISMSKEFTHGIELY